MFKLRGMSLVTLLGRATVGAVCAGLLAVPGNAQAGAQDRGAALGPYNIHVLAGGKELVKPVAAESRVVTAASPWTLSFWYQAAEPGVPTTLIAGLGDSAAESSRYVGLVDGRPLLRFGAGNQIVGGTALAGSQWHLLAASFDGHTAYLYADGLEVAQGPLASAPVAPRLVAGPVALPAGFAHYGGKIVGLSLTAQELPAAALLQMFGQMPDEALLAFEEASRPWPVQTRGQAGYLAPQDPATLPHSASAFATPVATALPAPGATLRAVDPLTWTLAANWRLASAEDVAAAGAEISRAGFDARRWLAATVPGTVLTTLVDRGVYPDPDFGLNNLAIPESLNRHDYWYRVEFETPRNGAGRHMRLTFNGINYAAVVWLNGRRLGDVKGAFIRGSFDVSGSLRAAGSNVLAVRISPPPHPGIPQEQSIKGGPGENGGALCLDGPTFVATEGWDWIPAIRDRNSGLWQDVVLAVSDVVQIGDPQVVTHLPLPDISSADVEIDVPLRNLSAHTVSATVRASFEQMALVKTVLLPAGETTLHLRKAEFPQLHVDHPRLWWPNGYGRADLYHLKLTVAAAGAARGGESDRKALTFGIREISYDLSLFDTAGRLRRVEVLPTVARASGEQVVDVRHEGMRQTPELWAASLTPAGERSSAVRPVADEPGLTDLVLKVNGVRIAARGGNWGMDDSRKRVSRQHLEPFFRLHRDAHLNIIRNWVGQDTEETFYQLADEYGLMVWNDFWASTQDYNVEPQDPALFLRNARDVVARFRNHPSIVMWCGRNEGVPQPILNEGLIDIFRELDGTRYYSPSSNKVNLRNSGPYRYQDPTLYYTRLDRGFSVELGIASLSTLESLRASMPQADQWPISDAWAYHDWHQSGNGDVHPLMQRIDEEFGAATSLEDFERKAQMFNYVDHRAIFEGFNQHLWQPNSGRMLWMTQPAWPSNVWQIFSSDYDTQASYYGVQKACEPLHIQLDLSDFTVAAINTTREPAAAVSTLARVYSLDNRLLLEKDTRGDLAADAATTLFQIPLAPLLAQEGVVLVKLEARDAGGKMLSENLYWLGANEAAYRKLNTLAPVMLSAAATARREGDEMVAEVRLTNAGTAAALATKLTALDAATGERILPAYLSDNYVSLLPGEATTITLRYPAGPGGKTVKVALRGWNIAATSLTIAAAR